jgi:hypothetical protein
MLYVRSLEFWLNHCFKETERLNFSYNTHAPEKQ